MQTKEDRSITTLFSDLTQETSTLLRKEVELAKAEISEKVSQTQSGLVSLAVGGAIAYAGLLVLLAAAVIGLADLLDGNTGLSALIIGIVMAIIGYVMLLRGRRNLKAENLTLPRTTHSLRRGTELAKEHMR